jgi:uncharacterized protein (TIGR03790 family)
MPPSRSGQNRHWPAFLLVFLLPVLAACDDRSATQHSSKTRATPTTAISAFELGLVVNTRDPDSRRIADYYIAKRRVPAANVVHVSFSPGRNNMPPGEFRPLKATVDREMPSRVQVLALAWTAPYRVGCMSLTTAFAAGFNAGFCTATCSPTSPSPYFNSDSRRPFDDFGWRPAMLLAGNDPAMVEALIDRGVAADDSQPPGTGYLVSTSDPARNVRARFFNGIKLLQSDRFRLLITGRNILQYRDDVMFYFTGLKQVEKLSTNKFLPGAIADHLTSAGGQLLEPGGQMSSLRWLEAGATGSYGAVTEPCNFVQKFPRPDIVIDRYLNGETLIEAYWKSVEWPGQGVFIGEPLAAPFRQAAEL